MNFDQWPNQVRKIWYGENEYGFQKAQDKTRELGYEIYFDGNLQSKLRPLS